jgi:translation elongation factor EF-1alpha
MHHSSLPEAVPGDKIGFNVKGIAAGDIKRGFVVGETARDPPAQGVSFAAQMIINNHPAKIHARYQPTSHASSIRSSRGRTAATGRKSHPPLTAMTQQGAAQVSNRTKPIEGSKEEEQQAKGTI